MIGFSGVGLATMEPVGEDAKGKGGEKRTENGEKDQGRPTNVSMRKDSGSSSWPPYSRLLQVL